MQIKNSHKLSQREFPTSSAYESNKCFTCPVRSAVDKSCWEINHDNSSLKVTLINVFLFL